MPISDTPITRLSKIFSQASFSENYTAESMGPSASRITNRIPADIDESANQEPPVGNDRPWLESHELYTTGEGSHNVLFNREFSNSYSSGYCSSATASLSAPPTCVFGRTFDFQSIRHEHDQTTNFGSVIKISDALDSLPAAGIKLRRTHSCVARTWLVKRQRRHQQWPHILGISRNKSTDASMCSNVPIDTNSCPPVFSSDIEKKQDLNRKFSLPPVGELQSSSTSEGSVEHPAFKDLSVLEDDDDLLSHTRPDISFHPVSKRQRFSSPSIMSPAHISTSSPLKVNLNDTAPAMELSLVEQDTELMPEESNDVECPVPTKPFFDLLRHHSTPLGLSRPANTKVPKHSSASPTSPENPSSVKPPFLRCTSDPSSIYDKLSRCINALDNNNLRCDGRRSRALPVVERMASGLHCVTTDTVAKLVSDSSKHKSPKFVIVDCRFPYEYEGGHIQGAINIFTHSDLVQEIFDRVPAQRPPGVSGPPRLLGEGLARRLAMTQREPLSAPCEPVSDYDTDDEANTEGNTTSEASELELAANATSANEELSLSEKIFQNIQNCSTQSEPDLSVLGNGGSPSSTDSGSMDSPFIVIFHCEFSSQRAPALAAFLRSVDRVSNYHRYPFLYFPEIYVMKGGYSAFYRKYPKLCCPQAYVKMFHRDYRSHLRLYKRLTRRVSSACLACIRPQHEAIMGRLDTQARDLDSFINPVPEASDKQASAVVPGPSANPSNLLKSNRFSGSALEHSAILSVRDFAKAQFSVTSDDKENVSPLCTQPDKPKALELSTMSDSTSDRQDHLNRRASGSLNSSDSDIPHHDSLADSPLNLAEVVVRVGRRVIAATLSSADPMSSEVARALDMFKERIPLEAISRPEHQDVIGPLVAKPILKSRSTINSLHPGMGLPLGGPNPFDESGCLDQTPANPRKRSNTLGPSAITPRLLKSRSNLLDLYMPETPISNTVRLNQAPTTDSSYHRLSTSDS